MFVGYLMQGEHRQTTARCRSLFLFLFPAAFVIEKKVHEAEIISFLAGRWCGSLSAASTYAVIGESKTLEPGYCSRVVFAGVFERETALSASAFS